MLRTTPEERLALGVTALLLAAGGALRVLSAPGEVGWHKVSAAASETPPDGGTAALRAAAEARGARDRLRATPLAPGERIDVNRAGPDELQRLPRVGPALAGRIVAHRAAHGPFRSLADLDRVPGVGPALLGSIAPHLALPPGPASGPAPGDPLDLNRASAEELQAVPGIGPALAARIVAYRDDHGEFRSLEELERVPGIGPRLRARLAPHLRVRS